MCIRDRDDAGMAQLRGDPDLAQEAIDADGTGQLGMENLDRDLALVTEVPGEPDGRHAPAADLLLDRVPACQCDVELVNHAWRVSRSRRSHRSPCHLFFISPNKD